MNRIYLDHNATTPLDPAVAEEMVRVLREQTGNPASQHEPGRTARRQIEMAREAIGQLLDIGRDDHIVFTSGGTEANNWALRGLVRGGTLITSSIEHPSILEAAASLANDGAKVRKLPVNSSGVVDTSCLSEWLHEGTQLVSVMLANNETGVIQPIRELAQICGAQGIPFHTDAVQAIGKLPVSFRELGVAAMTVAAHKFHGPPGIGALVMRARLPIRPLLFGGFQQAGLRPGTEAVALAVGMWKALERWHNEGAERVRRMRELRDRFESAIKAEIATAVIIGESAPRLPHTSNVSFVGCDRQALVMAFDLRGIACSTGSACASGSSEPSPVLQAMQLPSEVVNGSVRFSLGAFTTAAEIESAARIVISAVNQSRKAEA